MDFIQVNYFLVTFSEVTDRQTDKQSKVDAYEGQFASFVHGESKIPEWKGYTSESETPSYNLG